MRPSRRLTPHAAILVLAFAVGHADRAVAATPCDTAHALRAAGLLDEAEKSYQGVLEGQSAEKQCAVTGLAAVRRARDAAARRVARALADAGFEAAAVESVTEGLKTGRLASGVTEIAPLVGARRRLQVVAALSAAGFHETAAKTYEETIAAAPQLLRSQRQRALAEQLTAGWRIEAAERLDALGRRDAALEQVDLAVAAWPTVEVPETLADPARREDWWREPIAEFGPTVRSVAEALVVAFLALFLLTRLRPLGSALFGRRLAMQPLTGGPDDKLAPALTGAIEERYRKLIDENGGDRLSKIEDSAEAFTMPAELTQAFPQLGVVGAIVNIAGRLTFGQRWIVGGDLLARDPGRGVGLRLRIRRHNGTLVGEETVWEHEFGAVFPADDPARTAWYRLAQPAAAWLLFQSGSHHRLPFRGDREVLGTGNWWSYAQFAVGARETDVAAARERYESALRADRRNRGARFNLALLDFLGVVDLAHAGRPWEDAWERLRADLEELSDDVDRHSTGDTDTLWHRTRFVQAVIRLDRPDLARAQDGLDCALQLACAVLSCTRWPQWLIVGRRRRARYAFLREAEPGALVLVAAGLRLAARGGDPVDADMRRGKLYEKLEQIGDSGAAIDPDSLVAWTLRHHEPLDAPTAYNLACFYSLAPDEDRMLEALRDAIRLDPGLRRTAERDPILKRDAELHEAVLALLDEVLGPPPQPPSPPGPPPAESDRVVTVRVVRAPGGAVSATMALDEGDGDNGA